MLLQLRVTVPEDRTDRVRELFENDPGTAHLAVLPGASVSPAGDLVLADVARESADGLVSALRDLGVHRDGAISLTSIDARPELFRLRRTGRGRRPGPASGATKVVVKVRHSADCAGCDAPWVTTSAQSKEAMIHFWHSEACSEAPGASLRA